MRTGSPLRRLIFLHSRRFWSYEPLGAEKWDARRLPSITHMTREGTAQGTKETATNSPCHIPVDAVGMTGAAMGLITTLFLAFSNVPTYSCSCGIANDSFVGMRAPVRDMPAVPAPPGVAATAWSVTGPPGSVIGLKRNDAREKAGLIIICRRSGLEEEASGVMTRSDASSISAPRFVEERNPAGNKEMLHSQHTRRRVHTHSVRSLAHSRTFTPCMSKIAHTNRFHCFGRTFIHPSGASERW